MLHRMTNYRRECLRLKNRKLRTLADPESSLKAGAAGAHSACAVAPPNTQRRWLCGFLPSPHTVKRERSSPKVVALALLYHVREGTDEAAFRPRELRRTSADRALSHSRCITVAE